MHAKGYVHGDLKPSNIFLKSHDDLNVKITDFGISRRIIESHLHDVYGTSYYCAPEVLIGDYNEKCDVWSIGVIFYLLICGELPF